MGGVPQGLSATPPCGMMVPMDDLVAFLRALRHLPEQPRIVRVEVGQQVLDWLKAVARPEGAPPENPWRPVGWTPPPGISSLFGVPVVLREDMEPGAWRSIDCDGAVVREWKP